MSQNVLVQNIAVRDPVHAPLLQRDDFDLVGALLFPKGEELRGGADVGRVGGDGGAGGEGREFAGEGDEMDAPGGGAQLENGEAVAR